MNPVRIVYLGLNMGGGGGGGVSICILPFMRYLNNIIIAINFYLRRGFRIAMSRLSKVASDQLPSGFCR